MESSTPAISFSYLAVEGCLVPQEESSTHRKNNEFPFLDILGYLKNTHKNPKFGKVREVPTREFPTKFRLVPQNTIALKAIEWNGNHCIGSYKRSSRGNHYSHGETRNSCWKKGTLESMGCRWRRSNFYEFPIFSQSVRLISLSVCKQDRRPVHQAASFPRLSSRVFQHDCVYPLPKISLERTVFLWLRKWDKTKNFVLNTFLQEWQVHLPWSSLSLLTLLRILVQWEGCCLFVGKSFNSPVLALSHRHQISPVLGFGERLPQVKWEDR